MSKISLGYSDERDKCYGIAGMAITMVALDGENYLAAIHLDADPGETIVLTPEYGLKGNPRMSAKIVWEQSVNELRLSTSMILGNLACRRYVLLHKGIDASDSAKVRAAVREDAATQCSLEADEADRLFDSCMSYVDRIFRHAGIRRVADSFSEELTRRRSMTGTEVVEILASLGLR